MQTIEQLRNDPRPLVSLSEVCAVTGKPLGELLLQLADQDTPLFLTRPEKFRIFCVVPSQTLPLREETYQEVIMDLRVTSTSKGPLILRRGETYVEASHFNFLTLTTFDYLALTKRSSSLSANLFSEVAYIGDSENEPTTISASSYYRDHFENAQIFRATKARFICYSKNMEWPSSLNKISVEITPEKLLMSRKYLSDQKDTGKKHTTSLSPELQQHLQSWKSDLLIALNKAAFKFYSNDKENKTFCKEEAIAAINENVNGSRPSETTLNRLATLLRHDRQPANYKKAVNNTSTNKYPAQFSPQLIYLNEKCEKYHTDYQDSKNKTLPSAKSVKIDIQEDGVISKDTAIRVASALIPRLRHSTS